MIVISPAAVQFLLWATSTNQDHVFLSVGICRAIFMAVHKSTSVAVCKLMSCGATPSNRASLVLQQAASVMSHTNLPVRCV